MKDLLHFTLTQVQAFAVIDLIASIEEGTNFRLTPSSPLGKAANALDEQIANQTRTWEKCKPCKGSGWVEE